MDRTGLASQNEVFLVNRIDGVPGLVSVREMQRKVQKEMERRDFSRREPDR